MRTAASRCWGYRCLGTGRHVCIGTEAFARPIEWFVLDECEMTECGLSTPAVERINRSRRTHSTSPWAPGKARGRLAAVGEDARPWIQGQAEARRHLFSLLERAVDARDPVATGRLVVRVNATATHHRTDGEVAITAAADGVLADFARQQQAEAEALLAEHEDQRAREEAERARRLPRTLEGKGPASRGKRCTGW